MAAPNRTHPLFDRVTGLILVGSGTVVVVAAVMVPIPAFDELEPRPGTLVEARRERFSPCRRGDCTRTMVTIRHLDGVRRYHFADADTAALEAGAPITVWTYPEIRGFDRLRVWHAEQNGRVIRDHASLSAADRRIRIGLMLLAPILLLGGGWIARHYGWRGGRAEAT